MSLLQMSLSGAVMIVVIVAVRALAIHKLPKRAFLALWGIALARLLIPYSLPSAFSVYSLLGRLAPAAEAVRAAPAVYFAPVAPVQNVAPAAPAVSAAAAPADPLTIIWLTGALACAVFFVLAYLKCRREFRFSLPVDNECVRRWLGEHRIRRSIEIRQSDRISAPLAYGVLRPIILMPKTADWEDTGTLEYVLAHEYVHIRRFDAALKLLLTAALCVHWFNPAVWMMYVLANRDIELSCDEAVLRRFGEGTKSAYAMALIRMEETRSGFKAAPLCNNFSKNAIEERITAIMKIKKTSQVALFAAVALVAGVTSVFATNAKPDDTAPDPIDTAVQVSTMISLVDAQTGMTYYSLDGGITYESMTAEEYAARFPTPEVEWWTYEEYKAWLENEKAELQDLIGEKAWTSGRGEFVWTQEIVDEAIAMYEEILENIGRGMLYSKTINGDPDTSLTMSMNPADIWINTHEAIATSADFIQYKPFGLVWDNSEKALYFNGQRVRYFLDGVEVDGGMSIYLEYADAELKGEIDVHTVRQSVQNADGSFDPMGPLTGLEKYSQAEFDARSFSIPLLEVDSAKAQSVEAAFIAPGTAQEAVSTEELLQAYLPFGLSYEIDPSRAIGELSMSWQGKPVHSIFDAEMGVWIANSMRGQYLGPDAVDLEVVYERGKLTGLRETQSHAIREISFETEETAEAEPGTSFADRFAKYSPFGITYEEAKGASGAGNVYLNGRLVSRFADVTPDGGAFTFTSAKQGGITVRTVYDSSGRLTGAEAVPES